MKKLATTEAEIAPLIAERWSPRAFDPNFIMDDNAVKQFSRQPDGLPPVLEISHGNLLFFKKKMRYLG